MKLYEINEAIENCVDTETGEILDEAALDALKIEREEKIRNIAAWIVNLKDFPCRGRHHCIAVRYEWRLYSQQCCEEDVRYRYQRFEYQQEGSSDSRC